MHPIVQTFMDPIFPVFGIMLLGIVMARHKLFNAAGAQAVNRFVFFVALPALLFDLLSNAEVEKVDWRVLALYFLSQIVLFAVGVLTARLVFKRPSAEALLLGMASCFVNHAFFILPIVQRIYGEQASMPVTAIIVVDTTIIFAGTIIGLEVSTHRGEPLWRVPLRFARNPVLVSILLGLLVNTLKIELHEGIGTYTEFAGRAAAPAALFSLGIILAGPGAIKFDGVALLLTCYKVLLHPFVAWLLFLSIAMEPLWYDSALMVAAGPCGAMPFVLALQYQVPTGTIGKAIIYSTIASLGTLSIIA